MAKDIFGNIDRPTDLNRWGILFIFLLWAGCTAMLGGAAKMFVTGEGWWQPSDSPDRKGYYLFLVVLHIAALINWIWSSSVLANINGFSNRLFDEGIAAILWSVCLFIVVGFFNWLRTGEGWWYVFPERSRHSDVETFHILIFVIHLIAFIGLICLSKYLGTTKR